MHDTFRDNNEAKRTRLLHVHKQRQAHEGAKRLPNSSIFRLLANPTLVAGQKQDSTSCLGNVLTSSAHSFLFCHRKCQYDNSRLPLPAEILRTFYHNIKEHVMRPDYIIILEALLIKEEIPKRNKTKPVYCCQVPAL